MNKTFEELRVEFELLTNRSLSLPLAETFV
jgi:hypothetical protein